MYKSGQQTTGPNDVCWLRSNDKYIKSIPLPGTRSKCHNAEKLPTDGSVHITCSSDPFMHHLKHPGPGARYVT